MKLSGYICGKCQVLVYPRTMHDIISCDCENITVFRNENGVIVNTKDKSITNRLAKITLKVTNEELSQDLDRDRELFGRIRKKRLIDAKLLDKMIKCSEMLMNSEFFYEQWARLIQRKARQEMK